MIEADRALFLFINGLSGKVIFVDGLMRGLANDYLIPVSLSLLLLGLWFSGRAGEREGNEKAVLASLLSLGVVNLVVKLFNLVYFRPRPFDELVVNLLFYKPHDSSFPSNAAAVGFALFMAIFMVNRRASIPFFALACVLSLSRIYVGVHYPTDILGGAIIGLLCGVASPSLLKLIEPFPTLILRLARRLYLA